MKLRLRLPTLAPRDRRAIRLGASLLLPLLAWLGVWAPYSAALQRVSTLLAAERDLLARERALVAEGYAYPAQLAALGPTLEERLPQLLEARDDAAATAELASWVGDVVDGEAVLVTELEPVATDSVSRPGLVQTGLRISGETDLEGLLVLLREVELADMLLHVEQLHVDARTPTGYGAVETHETLSFRVRVAAYAVSRTSTLGSRRVVMATVAAATAEEAP